MRIIWNTDENWFQAELSTGQQFQDDMDAVRSAGFKTLGPPTWVWRTSKVSVLDKLRDLKPSSGLAITEIALEKYKLLKQQSETKKQLKKQFEKAKHAVETTIADSKVVEYESDSGVCIYVPPVDKPFVWQFHPPAPPEELCFVCGDPIYWYEYPDICLYCDKIQKEKLDKKSEIV